MDHKLSLPNPELLQMPLRDIARGLKGAAHATESALAPVAASLPKPLQSALSDALATLKSQGRSVMSLTVTQADIEAAARFIAGQATGSSEPAACAKVLAFAWDHLKLGDLVSETVLASHLGQVAQEPAPPEVHAAVVLHRLAESSAFGKLPGFPFPEGGDHRTEVLVALTAPIAWLLAEREGALADEFHLLDLSRALALAFDGDIRAALSDPAALAPLLKTLACHL